MLFVVLLQTSSRSTRRSRWIPTCLRAAALPTCERVFAALQPEPTGFCDCSFRDVRGLKLLLSNEVNALAEARDKALQRLQELGQTPSSNDVKVW